MAAKKTKSSRKPLSKSAFVRGLPATLPAKEVVAKAKDAGLTLSDRYVHVIRSIAKRSAKGGSGAKATRRGGRPISSKRTFVLGLPANLPAADVIKRAKSQGMKLTTNYVYKIRSRGAAAGGRPSAATRASAGTNGKRGRAISAARLGVGNGAHDEHFVTLVLDVGLARAAALLEKVRARVQELSL
ncbi:MAG TPA: hypothetical protein VHZ95_20345 [Polyangiales bacterium]|jgi:hypothetical protein|nr:hypothetical protein [Polyangiales bacterium]